MTDNMHVVYRYSDPANNPVMLGPLPNIGGILTKIEAPFNCTAQIRVTYSEFLDKLMPGDEIQGRFGNTDRHMRIDSMHYNDAVNTCTIYCVQTDMWIYSHQIAFEYEEYARLAGVELSPYLFWHKTTFQQKIRILYGFSIIPKVSPTKKAPDVFPDGGNNNRPPPLFGDPLAAWSPAQVQTSFFMQLATVRDIMGSVVDLYKPAWDADTTIRFYPPWKHNLNRGNGMTRLISHGRASVPTVGYGHGGLIWARERLNESPAPYGMEFERIYDISDEYDPTTLNGLTKQHLDTDKNEGEWWEVEVLNDCGQKLWVGDTVIGDFIGEDKEAVITRITYDQTQGRIRTYLYLGKAPATVTDRLNALRLAARRDLELTWMQGLELDNLVRSLSVIQVAK